MESHLSAAVPAHQVYPQQGKDMLFASLHRDYSFLLRKLFAFESTELPSCQTSIYLLNLGEVYEGKVLFLGDSSSASIDFTGTSYVPASHRNFTLFAAEFGAGGSS